VRNTRGVTGFVGPGSKPVPLSDAEVEKMGVEVVRMADIGVAVGDMVTVKSGPMEGFSGVVESVNDVTRKVIIKIDMFGKESTLEIDSNQVALAD
jgi:transcriptional antiterminator NusG